MYTLSLGDGWMVWDLKLKKAVKTRDIVFHKDTFLGIGEVSKGTRNGWVDWSTKISSPLLDHHVF